MEKYKSELVKLEDIIVYTDKRYIVDIPVWIVRVKHIPTGLDVSVEDKSQIYAYNIAIKEIESMMIN
jgi:hypothetical protein